MPVCVCARGGEGGGLAPLNPGRLGEPPKGGRKQKGHLPPAVWGSLRRGKRRPEGLGKVALSWA